MSVSDAPSCMLSFGPLLAGDFLQRDNRFRVQVLHNDEVVAAHLPNPGRLAALLQPGVPVLIRKANDNAKRRTAFDLVLVRHGGHWVSVNSQLPNTLMAAMLREGWLSGLEAYTERRREVQLGDSRIDFRLEGAESACWLEVKSVTLVEAGVAAFPDAPTARGRRHLCALMTAVAAGARATVIFIIQRPDATRFAPHDATDPDFGATLREAAQAGVEVRAVRCQVTPDGIWPLEEIAMALASRV